MTEHLPPEEDLDALERKVLPRLRRALGDESSTEVPESLLRAAAQAPRAARRRSSRIAWALAASVAVAVVGVTTWKVTNSQPGERLIAVAPDATHPFGRVSSIGRLDLSRSSANKPTVRGSEDESDVAYAGAVLLEALDGGRAYKLPPGCIYVVPEDAAVGASHVSQSERGTVRVLVLRWTTEQCGGPASDVILGTFQIDLDSGEVLPVATGRPK